MIARQAILLFAHGSRDPEWAGPFQRLKAMLQSSLPGQQIELAFLEAMSPGFDAAVDSIAGRGAARITVVPLFLAPGGHLREDVPRLIAGARARHPDLELQPLPALGDAADVLGAIAAWILASHVSR